MNALDAALFEIGAGGITKVQDLPDSLLTAQESHHVAVGVIRDDGQRGDRVSAFAAVFAHAAPPRRWAESTCTVRIVPDLRPPGPSIAAEEIAFLARPGPLLPTPRAAKKLVNLYRLVRITIPDAELT